MAKPSTAPARAITGACVMTAAAAPFLDAEVVVPEVVVAPEFPVAVVAPDPVPPVLPGLAVESGPAVVVGEGVAPP